MCAELQAALGGAAPLTEGRLKEIYFLLADRVYEIESSAEHASDWPACLATFVAVAQANPAWVEYAVGGLQLQAASLERLGRRGAAIELLRAGAERYSGRASSLQLRIDLGAYLRAENQFGAGLAELRAAETLLRQDDPAWRATDAGGNLAWFEPICSSELGLVAAELGMSDRARDYFAEADRAALRLGDATGPSVWGGNVVYRLNFVIQQADFREIDRLRSQFLQHPWREHMPRDTRAQIELRFAFADIVAAFRGKAVLGAREGDIEAASNAGLKPEESILAQLFLARSRLDRGAFPEARVALDRAAEALSSSVAFQPSRMQLAGLRAGLLRRQGAATSEREAQLRGELRPQWEAFLARTAHLPIEEAGVSILNQEWVHSALGELFDAEVAVQSGDVGARAALAWLLRIQAAGTLARELHLEAPSPEQALAELSSNERAFLAYVPGRENSCVFLLFGGRVQRIVLAPAFELEARARTLEEALSAALKSPGAVSDARLESATQAASDAFLPAHLQARLQGCSALSVCGLDDFGYVPLEVLRDAAGRLWGERVDVTYQASIPLALWLRERLRKDGVRSGPALYVSGDGQPELGGWAGLSDLTVAAQSFGAGAWGDAGAPERLHRGDLSALPAHLERAALAVILAHGLYDAERVRPAGLLLDPERTDGARYSADVERWGAPPFVCAAACGFDLAPLRRGDDGRGHLRAAFFRAGAACVAAPTLSLEASAAAELCDLLSRELARGADVASAVRRARRAARPERFGVPAVHSFLLHVFGVGELEPRVSPIAAQAEGGRKATRRAPRHSGATWVLVGLAVVAAGLSLRRYRRIRRFRSPSPSPRRD